MASLMASSACCGWSCHSQITRASGDLASILQSKRTALESQLATIPPGRLEKRIEALQDASLRKPFAMLNKFVKQNMQGKTSLVVEVSRISPDESKESFIDRCRQYASWGADVLSVSAGNDTSNRDLSSVCNAVDVPVLWKDWIIHPIQIAETREAGASAITVVHAVLKKGTSSLVKIAGSVGLDAVVEVVNLMELEELSQIGIPVFGINMSVGLKLAVPGIRQDIATSLVRNLPSGAVCIVGISSKEEAVSMRLASADAVYVRHEVVQRETSEQAFIEDLKYALTGDD